MVYVRVVSCHPFCLTCMLMTCLCCLLHQSDYECYVSKTFIGCVMYADDLILISPTVSGLQAMINIHSLKPTNSR